MRLLIVPLLLVGLLVYVPATALGNTNQQAADKIANTISEYFPDADIDVIYTGGQVWLKGEAVSQDQRKQIVEQVFRVSGVNVTEVNDEIQIGASGMSSDAPVPIGRPRTLPTSPPVPIPNLNGASPRVAAVALNNTNNANNARRMPQTQMPQLPARQMPAPQSWAGAMLATSPQPYYPPTYGTPPSQLPHQQQPVSYAQTSIVQPQAAQRQQPIPQQYAQQHQPAYGPQPQAAYQPEAYGPQGPLPGSYNQPNLPDHAWPSYAAYPNYAQVSYPRSYSPKAWPYIGPFYPYPQVPMEWRKVTLEHNNGWWWLDFDDGTPSGPFSGLFRQPARYTY